MDIKRGIAVITGAAGGIGRAVALELVKHDVSGLALVDFGSQVLDAAEEANALAGRSVATAFKGDVTDDRFRARVYAEVSQERGMANICVPAAGITRDNLAVKIDKETHEVAVYPIATFRQVIEVNLVAPVYWALQMVAGIAAERARNGLKRWEPDEHLQGVAVFIGSVSSLGSKGQIAYAATKAGLEGAASTLMMEAIFHGVRCTIIHPGYTDTPMVRALGDKFIEEQIIPRTQLRRLIRPEEIANAIAFMVTNAAVSGSLWADAGYHRPA